MTAAIPKAGAHSVTKDTVAVAVAMPNLTLAVAVLDLRATVSTYVGC